VLAVAILVTAVLTIPIFGVWCSVLVLTLGASAYGEIIRGVSRGATKVSRSDWYKSLVPKSIPEAVACFLMAAGTVIPLWYLNSGLHQSPHRDKIGLAITVMAWIALPVVMMMIYGRTSRDTPLGVAKGLRLVARHPFATILALAVVPLALALTEALLDLTFYYLEDLPFLALDFMPMPTVPDKPVLVNGVPYYKGMDFRGHPESMFYQGYFDGLQYGYSFVAAIPASLSLPTRADLNPSAIWLDEPSYAIARGFVSMLVVFGLLTSFVLQARWLGAIPALENRRPAQTASAV
jgi:hypothetical protein